MTGKTISTYTSTETARRVDHLSRVEDRKPSQIASAALDLYVQLPAEAHAALRHVQALGTAEDLARMTREITRVLLDARYEIAERRLVAAMKVDGLDDLETEEEILEEANRLTAPSRVLLDPFPATPAEPEVPETKGTRGSKRWRSV